MRILYIDPIFGISGDMMISALIDAGMQVELLQENWAGLRIDIPSITPVKKQQGIIEGIQLEIADSYHHLSVREMENLIAGSGAKVQVKDDALAMLGIILDAEAKIHGTTRDEVHLHELAHIDTLIDLVGVATGMHFFGVERVCCGPVPHGRGSIKTAHGIIPNPPPVTLEILSGFPSVFCNETLEMTTPTGAAIIRHFVKDKGFTPPLEIERIGYGVGSYRTEKPNVLRVMIGTSRDQSLKSTNGVPCDIGFVH